MSLRAAVSRCPVASSDLARLARAVLRAEGVRRASVSIALVGRRRIRGLNRRYLGRDRATDVIAFALEGAPGVVVGDIYCAPEVAAQAATRFGTTAADEVRRVVVHGVLHVLGYDHAAGAERTTGTMWRRQEAYLARFGGRGRLTFDLRPSTLDPQRSKVEGRTSKVKGRRAGPR